ncbi:MAG: Lrp/AsnC family transcriptional regulator [Alloprevotella sp.]|nr:Lrp/AsnC family transcriptional regulator [Alloprevotella sp.]
MSSSLKLDPTDIALLRILQAEGRLTTKELASRVARSPTPVYERVRRLEQEGYIRGYSAILDPDKLCRGLTVFCNVKLRELSGPRAEEFVSRIREIDEVTECYNISGSYDYMLKVMAPDMSYYRDFILNVLGALDNILSIESTFAMATLKSGPAIPL